MSSSGKRQPTLVSTAFSLLVLGRKASPLAKLDNSSNVAALLHHSSMLCDIVSNPVSQEWASLYFISAEHQLVTRSSCSGVKTPGLSGSIQATYHGRSTSIPLCVHLWGNFTTREDGSSASRGRTLFQMGVFGLMTGAAMLYRRSCIMPNSLTNIFTARSHWELTFPLVPTLTQANLIDRDKQDWE